MYESYDNYIDTYRNDIETRIKTMGIKKILS